MELLNVALGVIALLGILAFLKASCIAIAVWFDTAYPQAAAAMLELYDSRPRRCFILGLIDAALALFIGLALMNTQVLAILGMLLMGAVIICGELGMGIVYQHWGQRVNGIEASTSNTRLILRGGIAAELAFMMPVLGWLLRIGTVFRGLGAVVAILISRKYRKTLPETNEQN